MESNGGSTSSFKTESGSNVNNIQTNTTTNISIINYTGTGSNGTIAHGLGDTPNLVIVKNRGGGGNSWFSHWTDVMDNDNQIIYMNNTDPLDNKCNCI